MSDVEAKKVTKRMQKRLGKGWREVIGKMSEKHRCWVTEGYGCPYKIGNRYWDIYKCPYRREDSPCMKKKEN
ncbi:hypothetical protein CH330_01545 [candidate division WOR-3 bacterium JGI_Cruoil_03_51_56]|uniref:Uncharacterized protein n=1 Tax=candidate division WOR-3 bacterium JGI_Cruoil_03_51_56 TaxID=1973747 RepID=A0A235BXK4_UNCW3|nr:MAG: hypothetical protein CH330_01545 [candidate division WOR-3 bacterium JGI_Cruoil_03_51_56]